LDLPVARVQVDVGLPHLDRLFDYAVPETLAHAAVPGSRVRVRFAGRLVDGYVVERAATSDQPRLAEVSKSLSDEVVLPVETIELVRAVADHYAGTFSDVVRLAVPSRHAATERAEVKPLPEPPALDVTPGPLASYPEGAGYLTALRSGASPRAAWTVVPVSSPTGDWAEGFAAAAAACVASGRSAVIVVPDLKDVMRVLPAVERRVGRGLVARQTADLGPAARYRAFLRGSRGQARVVVGTRSAVFAPVADLGLVCVWDDGDDLLSDPHAPYPHARDVAAIRVTQRSAALLLGSYARTAEVQSWVARGWVRPIALSAARARTEAPAVRIAADDDLTLERDPSARAARLPHQAFTVVRTGLSQGPVLVQVPRAGYVVSLSCRTCREPVRCPYCRGRVRTDVPAGSSDPVTTCTWCGRTVLAWSCPHCGGTTWRSARVGSSRTAEELGRAFPGVTVRQSAMDNVLTHVDSSSCLVVATPGAEPVAEGGYAAALLLDTTVLLNRPDLRAGEEALRRWLLATALVRPATEGGTVLAVGPSAARALQALTRVDPAGFAERELAERTEAGLPPAVRLGVAQGDWGALTELGQSLTEVPDVVVLGPALVAPPEDDTDPLARLVVKAPLASGPTLADALRTFMARRSARKDQRAVRVKVDPVDVG
jgi:primosomal protein N' (replication factor Y) (superfamily II helicase)